MFQVLLLVWNKSHTWVSDYIQQWILITGTEIWGFKLLNIYEVFMGSNALIFFFFRSLTWWRKAHWKKSVNSWFINLHIGLDNHTKIIFIHIVWTDILYPQSSQKINSSKLMHINIQIIKLSNLFLLPER